MPLIEGKEGYTPPLVSYSVDFKGTRLQSGDWCLVVKDSIRRLFRHSDDPGEHLDRIAEEPDRALSMERVIRALRAEKIHLLDLIGSGSAPGSESPLSPDQLRQLKALGYL